MPVNKTIIVSVVIIMATGLYKVLVIQRSAGGFASTVYNTARGGKPSNPTVTHVIVGAYILGIVASIVDLLGGPFRHVGGVMLLLAAATALYAVIPDIALRLGQGPQSGGGGGGGGGGKVR